MLVAIADRLSGDFRLAAPTALSDYEVRSRLGLWQSLQVNRYPRASMALGNALPRALRKRYGLSASHDVRGVVDASGFAYSDAFQLRSIQTEAAYSEVWSKRHLPKVMLPQAFGPFNDQDKARFSSIVLDQAGLVFARDDTSLSYLEDLKLSTIVKRAPDFTIPLSPPQIDRVMPGPFVAIVPNSKIVAKQVAGTSEYVSRLVEYGNACRSHGVDALVVVHESGDLELGTEIGRRLVADVFTHENPMILKAVIGQSELVVSSRFHAIVGGLSQGVPTLALGWSHKYRELLKDFGVENWLVTMDEDPANVVRSTLDDTAGRDRLKARKRYLVQEVDQMWKDTISHLKQGQS